MSGIPFGLQYVYRCHPVYSIEPDHGGDHNHGSQRSSWLSRLRAGVAKTSQTITDALGSAFTKKEQKARTDIMERALLRADLGPQLASELAQLASKQKDFQTAQEAVRHAIMDILHDHDGTFHLNAVGGGLNVILMAGVNGGGKTTTCGKLAARWQKQGYRVGLIAADIFRAAAVDQLKQWAATVECAFYQPDTTKKSKDASGFVFEALEYAQQQQWDIAIVDTAGRLHSHHGLMDELKKIQGICGRFVSSPKDLQQILVLDGTVGQNALIQREQFAKVLTLDGLIVTKLDGTTKAGVIVALARNGTHPFLAIGLGEGVDHLQDFSPKDFAESLLVNTSDTT